MRKGWFLLLTMFASLAFGQVGNGTITGVVTDASGAIVAAAAVEARNTETGVAFRGVSTNAGDYAITDLPVGIYAVTVTGQGVQDLHPHEPRPRGDANPEGGHRSAGGHLHGIRDRHRRSFPAADRKR